MLLFLQTASPSPLELNKFALWPMVVFVGLLPDRLHFSILIAITSVQPVFASPQFFFVKLPGVPE